jgi:hypothetical protein
VLSNTRRKERHSASQSVAYKQYRYASHAIHVKNVEERCFLERIFVCKPEFFQQFKLADMETRIQSSRLLTWQAACMMDAGQNYTKVQSNTSSLIRKGLPGADCIKLSFPQLLFNLYFVVFTRFSSSDGCEEVDEL